MVRDSYWPHVVIVGAGFGGLNTALILRKAKVRITLVDKNNHHLFQPLLYQVATAGLSPADIAVPIRSVLRRQRNVEVFMGEVVGIDRQSHRVWLAGGSSLTYDYLVLAPGAHYNYFGHPEWERVAPALKTIADATAIRRKILLAFERAEMAQSEAERQANLTFVIVGAGPTGVEMAGSIAELAHRALAADFRRINPRSARILLVEAGPRILSGFPEHLANRAREELQHKGVEVLVNTKVEAVDERGVVILDQRIEARTVLWAAGVLAAPVGQWLGVETDRIGRVKVNADLSVPGHPECFVIGDSAFVAGPDGKPLPGVAPVAMQQGRYVARVIQARTQGKPAPGPFQYRNKGNLATVGRSFAVADFGRLRLAGFIAWLVWTLVHIFYLIDFHNRVLVMIEWAWAYFTYHRGARLIVSSRETLRDAAEP